MLQLTTHEHVQIYVDTLFALARDARAERNTVALEFVGRYLVKLLPDRTLEAFRQELRDLPVGVGVLTADEREKANAALPKAPVEAKPVVAAPVDAAPFNTPARATFDADRPTREAAIDF